MALVRFKRVGARSDGRGREEQMHLNCTLTWAMARWMDACRGGGRGGSAVAGWRGGVTFTDYGREGR